MNSTLSVRLLSHIIFLSLFLLTPQVQAENFYKWTDEDGTTHYDRTPPTGRDAEKVNTQTQTSKQIKYQKQNKPDTDTPAEPVASTDDSAASKKDPERCKQAQTNLKTMQDKSRIKIKDENGEYRYLDKKEIAGKIQEMKDIIKEEC